MLVDLLILMLQGFCQSAAWVRKKHPTPRHGIMQLELMSPSVLVLAGIELIFLIVPMGLYFGFVLKTVLIIQRLFYFQPCHEQHQ